MRERTERRPRVNAGDTLRSNVAAAAETLPSISGIRGYAWMWGPADRLNRIIPKSAVAPEPVKVPLLAYHDDQQPIGSATLTPDDIGLRYEATFAKENARVEEVKGLIRDGAIPGVSIGWLNVDPPEYDGDFWDWNATMTCPKVEIVELSVVPVPANPLVTIQAASLLGGGKMSVTELLDAQQAVGKRNSANDQEMIQTIHDTTAALGATCGGAAPADEDEASLRRAGQQKQVAELVLGGPGTLVSLIADVDRAMDNVEAAFAAGDTDPTVMGNLVSIAGKLVDQLMGFVGVPDDPADGEASAGLGVTLDALDLEARALAFD